MFAITTKTSPVALALGAWLAVQDPSGVGGGEGDVQPAKLSSPDENVRGSTRYQELSELLGSDLRRSHPDASVGTVEDLVVDLRSGAIVYVAVDAGDGLLSISPGNLRYDARGGVFRVERDPADIGQTFEDSDWPLVADAEDDVKGTHRVYRLSELNGASVESWGGEDLGDVHEIVVDCDRGDVAYAVLARGGLLGLGEKYYAVPLGRMRRHADDDHLVLAADPEDFERARALPKTGWRDELESDPAEEPREEYAPKGRYEPEHADGGPDDALTREDVDTDDLRGVPVSELDGLDDDGSRPGVRHDPYEGENVVRPGRDDQVLNDTGWQGENRPEVPHDFEIWHIEWFGPPPAPSPYDGHYVQDHAAELDGKIVSVSQESVAFDAPELQMNLWVDTNEGTRLVHLGPASYVHRVVEDLHRGQKIQVDGCEASVDGRPVIIAREITIDGETIALRSGEGHPRWSGTPKSEDIEIGGSSD